MINVLYEHVDTSIDERFELIVSFNEFRLELLLLLLLEIFPDCCWGGGGALKIVLRVSEVLRLLDVYRVESVDVFDENRCSGA